MEIMKHWNEYKPILDFVCWCCDCEFRTNEYWVGEYTLRKEVKCPECESTDVDGK